MRPDRALAVRSEKFTRLLSRLILSVGGLSFAYLVGRLIGSGRWGRALLIAALPAASLLAGNPQALVVTSIALLPFPLRVQGLGGLQLHWIIIAALVLLVLFISGQTKNTHRQTLPWFPIVFAMLTVLASTLLADRPSLHAGMALAYLAGLGLMICIASLLSTPESVRQAIIAIGLSGAAVAFIALGLYLWPGLPVPGLLGDGFTTIREAGLVLLRGTGPIGDYELLGEFLALAAVVQFWLTVQSRGLKWAFWAAALGFSLVGIFVTASRGAAIQFGLQLIILVTAGRKQRLLWLRKRWRVALGTGVAGTAILAALAPVLTSAASSRLLLDRFRYIDTSQGVTAFLNRTSVWRLFMKAFREEFPLAFGTGPAESSMASNPAYPLYEIGTYPHGLWIYLLYTLGVAGVIAYALLLATVLKRLFGSWIATRREETLVLLAMAVGYLASEIKVESFRLLHYQWFVWAFLGICFAASRLGPGGGRTKA